MDSLQGENVKLNNDPVVIEIPAGTTAGRELTEWIGQVIASGVVGRQVIIRFPPEFDLTSAVCDKVLEQVVIRAGALVRFEGLEGTSFDVAEYRIFSLGFDQLAEAIEPEV